MALEHIEHHFHEALVKLVPPFWGKPVIAALLRSYINRVQEFEDDCIEVMNAFNVNTCDATRLAVLGRVVGQPNMGWGTETYRAVVRAKIAANRSHGREDDIVNVIRLATGGDAGAIQCTHLVPATVLVDVAGTITDDHFEALLFLLPKTRSAGVSMLLTVALEGGFTIDSSVAPLAGAGTIDSSATPDADAGVIGTAVSL